MPSNPRGYFALYARVCQTSRLTNDARLRLASAIDHAPTAYTQVDTLNKALLEIISADQALQAVLAHLFSLADDEARSEHATPP
jgi:hypothetical protein